MNDMQIIALKIIGKKNNIVLKMVLRLVNDGEPVGKAIVNVMGKSYRDDYLQDKFRQQVRQLYQDRVTAQHRTGA